MSNYIVAAAAIRFEQRANFLTVHVGPAGLAGFSSALIYSACVSAAVVTDKTYNNSNNNSNKQRLTLLSLIILSVKSATN